MSPSPSKEPIRVLMISKACVVGIYQRKLEEIAAFPDIDLAVLVPPYWKDARGKLTLEEAYTRGYRLLVEHMRFNGNFHLHYYPALGKHIRAVQPDIIHIDEEPYNLATAHALWLARQNGARSLFFSWQNIHRCYPPPFSWLEQWVLKNTDYGIVGNQDAEQVWRRKGYRGPLALIPQFGVDPMIFAPPTHPDPREHFTIGFAGRLVPEKGLDMLIKTVALLPGKWRLRILGEGPEREALIEMAGVYNISGSITFEPPIPSVDMPTFYHHLDVLVLPSLTRPNWREQFGRILIEAMACGVPVVGAQSGAIPGVIGDAGLTFPEGDETVLREHLAALMQHPRLREELGQAGRRRVLEHFTQSQIAASTVDIYRQMGSF